MGSGAREEAATGLEAGWAAEVGWSEARAGWREEEAATAGVEWEEVGTEGAAEWEEAATGLEGVEGREAEGLGWEEGAASAASEAEVALAEEGTEGGWRAEAETGEEAWEEVEAPLLAGTEAEGSATEGREEEAETASERIDPGSRECRFPRRTRWRWSSALRLRTGCC